MPTITGTQFYGTVAVSGSLTLSGSITSTEVVASASFATTATTASFATTSTTASFATNAATSSALVQNIAIEGRVYNPIGTTITTNTSIETLNNGTVYPIDTAGGNVVITVRTNQPAGAEFSFFIFNDGAARSASFAASGTTLYSFNGYLKMYGTGSFVTVKYFDSTRVVIYGNLKP